MRYLRILGVAMFLLSLLAVSVQAGEPKTDAVALVKSAVAFYKANGMEKTLDEIPNPKGQFNKGELYVFIYDLNATLLAHPNTKLIGQNMLDLPDLSGKKYRKEIMEKAVKDGKGWTDYQYQNPKSKEIESKTTYFEKIDDIVICCGIYKK
jgi:cytochrome c